jgi:dTDP-4-amino-4,6-dideoxygalactose transaminase
MPSFTFVSTANAFATRGASIRFVDIRKDTMNLDENLIEQAITKKTKAIVCVHYAGVSCEMDKILEIAKKYNLFVIEDAAQALMSSYKGMPLGSIGNFGAFSFHETKNYSMGEGGALLIKDPKFADHAEIIREKGTNRCQFHRGEIDKYTWVDIGSSYLPSDMIAAFLYSQLENMDIINKKRMEIWNKYHEFFKQYEKIITRPYYPSDCKHNAHMYYLLFKTLKERAKFIDFLKENNILSVFHYIPLHSSPAGKKYCKTIGSLDITNQISNTLVRLPMYYKLDEKQMFLIMSVCQEFLEGCL